uniref:Uncharacterized protein n=1 Tax=Peronospora matthiolae TaxID=2874970 RepID=A0AAV1TX89_9STRA
MAPPRHSYIAICMSNGRVVVVMEAYRSDPVQDTYQEHQALSQWALNDQSLIATLIMNLVA